MSVKFSKIVFKNHNSIDINIVIEAPIGTALPGTYRAPLNGEVTINPNVENVKSVLLIVNDDGNSHPDKQSFEIADPHYGQACYLYLSSVVVNYQIGSFKGIIQAQTEGAG